MHLASLGATCRERHERGAASVKRHLGVEKGEALSAMAPFARKGQLAPLLVQGSAIDRFVGEKATSLSKYFEAECLLRRPRLDLGNRLIRFIEPSEGDEEGRAPALAWMSQQPLSGGPRGARHGGPGVRLPLGTLMAVVIVAELDGGTQVRVEQAARHNRRHTGTKSCSDDQAHQGFSEDESRDKRNPGRAEDSQRYSTGHVVERSQNAGCEVDGSRLINRLPRFGRRVNRAHDQLDWSGAVERMRSS